MMCLSSDSFCLMTPHMYPKKFISKFVVNSKFASANYVSSIIILLHRPLSLLSKCWHRGYTKLAIIFQVNNAARKIVHMNILYLEASVAKKKNVFKNISLYFADYYLSNFFFFFRGGGKMRIPKLYWICTGKCLFLFILFFINTLIYQTGKVVEILLELELKRRICLIYISKK